MPAFWSAFDADSRAGGSVFRDEKGKIPLARRGCLLIIIGSGLGELRVPQNPGVGQKGWPDRNILGVGGKPQKCGMKGKLGGGPGRVWLITI